jgi:hypothetical protein
MAEKEKYLEYLESMEFIKYMESDESIIQICIKLTHWQGNHNPEAAVCPHCACNKEYLLDVILCIVTTIFLLQCNPNEKCT